VPTTVRIYLERGSSRTFACALDWPGWARSGRGDEAALDALLGHAERYAAVAARAGARFPTAAALEVVERLAGTPTTDFGAPDVVATSDREPLAAAALRRQVALLQASWQLLDDVVAAAPEALRKGPRGGGRDRDAVRRHVEEAERSYARKVGVRHPPYRTSGDVAAMREELAAALLSGAAAGPWPAAYLVRRTAWHVLDHAWEIEDRSP
jgi:hypothetical protein